MSKLSELNFLLEEKYQELEKIKLNTFVLNKNIFSLLDEINEIKQLIEIEEMEEEINE